MKGNNLRRKTKIRTISIQSYLNFMQCKHLSSEQLHSQSQYALSTTLANCIAGHRTIQISANKSMPTVVNLKKHNNETIF